MSEVSIRELRNHGGDVVDRAARGEQLTITRSGKPVAVLGPLDRDPFPLAVLIARWAKLPHLDPAQFREDIDRVLDPSV